jgi:quinol monooxygenase YgiN
MFVLLVELEAAESREAELERVLRGLVETARTEPGVLFYAIQRPEGEPGKFILYEYYESKAAWQTHLAFEPVKAELARFDALLKQPATLTLCDVVANTGAPAA